MDEDEYNFEASLSSASSKEADAFKITAKKGLANKLRPIFQRYPKVCDLYQDRVSEDAEQKVFLFSKEMIETHGKDLLADEGDSAPASGATTTSSNGASAPVAASAPTASKPTADGASKAAFNTAIVKSSGEFACTADDLFDFLTNESKIPMWSRNPAKMKAEVGAEMSLFGGNISGKFLPFYSIPERADGEAFLFIQGESLLSLDQLP